MKKQYLRLVQVVATGSLFAACGVAPESDDSSGVAESALSFDGMTASQVAAARALPDLRVLKVDARGLPRYLEADVGVLRDDRAVREADLKLLQVRLAPLLRMGPYEQLTIRRSVRDEDGKVHFWLGQTIAGAPVINSEIIVHTAAKSGAIESLQLWYLPDEGLQRAPRISGADIFNKIPADEIPFPDARLSNTPRLAYLRGDDGGATLGWQFEVLSTPPDSCPPPPGNPPSTPGIVFADGDSGHVRWHDSYLKPALFRTVYSQRPIDRCNGRPPKDLLLTEGGTTTNAAAAKAYDFSGATYNFLSSLGRDSWDSHGSGMVTILSAIDPDQSFWLNGEVSLGNGGGAFGSFANSIDVVAHEFGHGVVESTANLTYLGESGALNESIADVVGVSTKVFNRGGTIDAETWKIGVETWTPGTAGDALRYMNNPGLDTGNFPPYVSSDYYPRRLITDGDKGGVHFNSGISNLAFYLVSQGGAHPRLNTGVTVSGIGISKATEIWYKALSRLSAGSGFVDMRAATGFVAITKYGASSPEHVAVCKAWDAVGVPTSDNCPPAPPPIPDVPPAPTNVVVTSEHCRTLNTVQWEGTGPRFEILAYPPSELDPDATNPNPLVLFSGAVSPGQDGYERMINASEGVRIRVRACNASGCSSPSTSIGLAHSTSGCS